MYAAADRMLGRLVKVTPSSKVVGDLALHLVGAGVDPKDFEADPGRFDIPDSVIGFLRGELGDPPGGWPEPFRTKALRGPRRRPSRVAELTDGGPCGAGDGPAGDAQPAAVPRADQGVPGTPRAVTATPACWPARTSSTACGRGKEYAVDLEPGVRLLIELEAIGEADERGMRTVMATLNGQLRPIQVRDRSVASDLPVAEKADRANPGHVAAPFAGVVTLAVAEGDEVAAGATVATIEAMKMEAAITAPKAGQGDAAGHQPVQQVEGGDLLVEIE